MHGIGVDTVGVDYRMPLDVAAQRVGADVPLQGNLDPALLAAPWPVLEAAVRDVLRPRQGRAGARLQPRPRRAARDRSDRADPRGRARARGGGMTDATRPIEPVEPRAASRRTPRRGAGRLQPERRTTDVVVIGGGVAGLVAALECAKVGLRVTVLERRDAIGGCVGRIELDGLTLDSGAESFATRGGAVAELLGAARTRRRHRDAEPRGRLARDARSRRPARRRAAAAHRHARHPREPARRGRAPHHRLERRDGAPTSIGSSRSSRSAARTASGSSCATAWATPCSTASWPRSPPASTPRTPTTSTSTSWHPASTRR